MKRLILAVLGICFMLNASSQTTGNPISVVSPKLDTLYLVDSHLGKLVAEMWNIDSDKVGKKPVIVFVEYSRILSMSTMSRYKRAKKKLKRINNK